MKTTQFNFSPSRILIGLVFILNFGVSAHASVLAYWRMEGQSSVVCTFNGVTDSATASGQGTKTGGCAASGATNDALITFNDNGNTVSISSTVPPTNMFNADFSGGVGSYNAEAILNENGALFFPQDQYGDEFSTASWTFEMFIKATGNQNGNGIQSLLKNDENNINYGITLNEPMAGSLRLFIYNGSGFPTVDLTNRNYADGTWHYIVCSYDQPTKKLSIRVRSENGLVSSNSTTLSVDPVVGPAGNLFLGRDTFNNSASPRTFRGLMDEVRISDNVIADGSLLGLIKADSTNVLTSSLNPGTNGLNIMFVATVSGVNITNGTPTGTVQFKTNGAAMGGPVTLINGAATNSTAALPVGTHTVTAEYAGNGKFYGSTNSIQQVINPANTAPVALGTNYYRVKYTSLKINITNLLDTRTSDADGAARVLQFLQSSAGLMKSANGYTIFTNAAFIFYTNAATSLNDSFDYVIADTGSPPAYATNTITITVINATGILTATNSGGGSMTMSFYGIPNFLYVFQRSPDLSVWTDIVTNTAPTSGNIGLIELTEAPPYSPAFYRTRTE